ncbi:MAG: aldo/keto reductase [Chloroflexi bacterium]|nr:aldo/keto reductase [Chloroflexota bacterium]
MHPLDKIRLGRTEMRVTRLALGCAWMGAENRTDQQAIDAVHCAIDLGINLLDTSPGYRESERRLGLALQGGWRDRIYLETKAGTHPDHRGDYGAATIRLSVENSLRQLKTDYLDSVLIHDPADIEAPLAPGAALDELCKMKQQGLVGHVGLGVRQHHFHRRAIETGQIEIVLTYLDYTLLDQSVAGTTLPLAAQRDVGIVLGSILGMGKLSGREPANDERAHAMWRWCQERGIDIRHLAMQFCMAAPYDNLVVMPGPSTAEHVQDVYRMAETPVDPAIWRAFRAEFGVGLVG